MGLNVYLQRALDRSGLTARAVRRLLVERLPDDPKPPSTATVARWFTGETDIRGSHLVALADVLGVSLDDLAGRDAYAPDLTPAERSIVEIVRTVGVAEARRLLLAPQEPVVEIDPPDWTTPPARRRSTGQ